MRQSGSPGRGKPGAKQRPRISPKTLSVERGEALKLFQVINAKRQRAIDGIDDPVLDAEFDEAMKKVRPGDASAPEFVRERALSMLLIRDLLTEGKLIPNGYDAFIRSGGIGEPKPEDREAILAATTRAFLGGFMHAVKTLSFSAVAIDKFESDFAKTLIGMANNEAHQYKALIDANDKMGKHEGTA